MAGTLEVRPLRCSDHQKLSYDRSGRFAEKSFGSCCLDTCGVWLIGFVFVVFWEISDFIET